MAAHAVGGAGAKEGESGYQESVEWKNVCEMIGGQGTARTEEGTNKLLALLSKQKLFQGLPYDTRVELSRCMYYEKVHKKGVDLIPQHELHRHTGPWRWILWGVVEARILSGQGKTAHEYTKGDCVGDQLTLRALPTGTSFVTAGDGCAFLCLSHADYTRLLGAREEEEVERRAAYFRALVVPLFASWSASQLRDLARRTYLRRFASRQVIVRENEVGTDIYFILGGECRVVREVEILQGSGGARVKKMVKLLELAALQPYEYFGECAPFNLNVDQNGKYRSGAAASSNEDGAGGTATAAAKKAGGGGPAQLLPPMADDTDDEDSGVAGLDDWVNMTFSAETAGVRQATVFSYTPLEVLVLPAEAIKDLLVGNPLQRVREYAKGYPTALEIKNQYTVQHDWATFKQDLVKDIISCHTR